MGEILLRGIMVSNTTRSSVGISIKGTIPNDIHL